MELRDQETGIVVDDAFPCSSAGDIRRVGDDRYEIGFKPEEIPGWFQDLLNELFDGAGVPKEYMAHVRVANTGQSARCVTLRFLLSPKGKNYMFPPWWIHKGDGWAWVATGDTDMQFEDGYVDLSVTVAPGQSVRVASAPYDTPEGVRDKCIQLADRSPIFSYREIGKSAQGRAIPVLETPARPLKLLVDASMQSCEPVSWGILHVAHWLTIPSARARSLLDQVQFSLMPMTNPDGVAEGRSVTNAMGEVPKFGINDLVEGTRPAPRETAALWDYLMEFKPDASLEVHAHFTRDGFTRSIGMHDKASMPKHLQAKAAVIEEALFTNYHADPLDNRKVLIDPREPEHNVYGDRYVSEKVGAIRVFLQAVPDSLESHAADVREMVETIANALVDWKKGGSKR
jgi:hypothetical protein